MNVQLLLLLALAGPFCAFTNGNPTPQAAEPVTPFTDSVADVTAADTEAPKYDVTVITGPPATEPPAAPAEVTTEVVTEGAPPVTKVNTEEPFFQTEGPAAETQTPEPLMTEPPAVETAAPTKPAEAEVQPAVTEVSEQEIGNRDQEVDIEDGTEAGLSSGQVAGIVIGALLAVVIVIAVVIAVVRRMGKYSSAKNKKTAKKDSAVVSPLRKKMAKQPERPKFWKF